MMQTLRARVIHPSRCLPCSLARSLAHFYRPRSLFLSLSLRFSIPFSGVHAIQHSVDNARSQRFLRPADFSYRRRRSSFPNDNDDDDGAYSQRGGFVHSVLSVFEIEWSTFPSSIMPLYDESDHVNDAFFPPILAQQSPPFSFLLLRLLSLRISDISLGTLDILNSARSTSGSRTERSRMRQFDETRTARGSRNEEKTAGGVRYGRTEPPSVVLAGGVARAMV